MLSLREIFRKGIAKDSMSMAGSKPLVERKLAFENIPFGYSDVLRGQYFIESLEKESKTLISFINTRKLNVICLEKLLVPLLSSLVNVIDQMILPVIVHEMAIARKIGALIGDDGGARYESFFVSGGEYTDCARSIPLRYPLLFQMIDTILSNTLRSARKCLVHLMHDLPQLKEHLFVEEDDPFESMDILGKSDPHLGHRTFVLRFKSGKRVIHKSVDLTADQLYHEFVGKLELPYPYDLKTMRVISNGHEYGWIEHINHQECHNIQQVKNFYCRAGVLLAIADCLNYSDGHFENLIAVGEYPVLLDGETFFQNYSVSSRREHQKKNILSTSLIQKPPSGDMQMGYAAAFQAPPMSHFEVVFPFALNDQTDEIELRYRGVNDEKSHNCPAIEEDYFTVHDFVENLIEGFSFAFEHLKKHMPRILSDTKWWDQVAKVKSRTVLRDTMAYCYLLRRTHRPEACISEATIKNILEAKLGNTPYAKYEIEDLMKGNVPYFYQHPGERHLYQGDGRRHRYRFVKTGVEALKEQLLNWNQEYKAHSIEILKKHLVCTPRSGEQSYYF